MQICFTLLLLPQKSLIVFRKPVQNNFPSTFPTSSKCQARQRCCKNYKPQFDLSKLNGVTLGSQWLRWHGNWGLTFVFLWAPYMVFYFNLIFVPLVFFPPSRPSSLHSPFKIEQKTTVRRSLEGKIEKVFQDARVAPITNLQRAQSCWWALVLCGGRERAVVCPAVGSISHLLEDTGLIHAWFT